MDPEMRLKTGPKPINAANLQNRSSFVRNAENMLLGKKPNVLLVKDDVGRAKPFTRNLPSSDFAFGKMTTYCESAGDGKHTKTN